jgi:hypothetical protein
MSDSGSIVNIGDLTKPATVLIEMISDAIGGVARPWQILRVARAEAEAQVHSGATSECMNFSAGVQSNLNREKDILSLLRVGKDFGLTFALQQVVFHTPRKSLNSLGKADL